MAAAVRMSLQEYLLTPFEVDADFVDGEVWERNVGENKHCDWQVAITDWFRAHRKEWNVRVRPEFRVQVLPGNFQISDVTIQDRALPDERYATVPPLAVFEVLSPDDRVQRVQTKMERYAAMGIPAIFQVDPETGLWSRFVDGALIRCTRFELPQSGIAFDLEEIGKLVD